MAARKKTPTKRSPSTRSQKGTARPKSAPKPTRAARSTAPRPKPKPKPKPKRAKPKRRLPVLAERQPVGCLTCGLCCTYIAVGIDGPTNAKSATEILWHLYHEGVSVYRDGDNEWMVQFESRCRHLLSDNKCGIYDTRPHICRDYSEVSCEVNSDGEGTTFYSPAEFLSWLETKKRRVYDAISATHVPSRDTLGRSTGALRNHEPFEARFLRIRALGAPPERG
jgi:Fe-S-cluster containining protein